VSFNTLQDRVYQEIEKLIQLTHFSFGDRIMYDTDFPQITTLIRWLGILAILCAGTPDLLDAIIQYVLNLGG